MSTKRARGGFTFVEILVVIAVLSIIATISAVTFMNMNRAAALRAVRTEIHDALTTARERTLASENSMRYGVHIGTSSITRFEGDAYSAGDSNNVEYIFSGAVLATSTLTLGNADIVFQKLTGTPSASGVIYVHNEISTSTIVVHVSGLVE